MVKGREPTGIPGFDKLIEGGLPTSSVTLVSGSPGTGKSIFAQQFLYNGATKFNEKGLYISFEQRVSDIFKDAAKFGWDFESLEKKGLCKFMFIDMSQRMLAENESYIGLIERIVKEYKPKRLVIDSLVPLSNFPVSAEELEQMGMLKDLDKLAGVTVSSDLLTRMQVHRLVMVLKDIGATSIVISEIPKESKYLSSDRVSEFMCDGVLVLHYLGIGTESNRSLVIEKMRGTHHAEDTLPMKIDDKGLHVEKAEDAYKV